MELWLWLAGIAVAAFLLNALFTSGQLSSKELEARREIEHRRLEAERKQRWDDETQWLRPLATYEFELMTRLRSTPAEPLLRNASPREFEQLIALLLEAEGWDAEVTPPGTDEGIDVNYGKNGITVGVGQVKHWPKTNVGRQILQQTIGAAAARSLRDVLLATSGEFTTTVRQYKVPETRIRLWNRASALSRMERLTPEKRSRLVEIMPDAVAALSERIDEENRFAQNAPPPPVCHGDCELHDLTRNELVWICAVCELRFELSEPARCTVAVGAYPVIRRGWLRYRYQSSLSDLSAGAIVRAIRARQRDRRPEGQRYRRRHKSSRRYRR